MRRRLRRKKTPEHPNHERWLVSYADFITLLFAFFVVLYASAQVDNKRVAQVAAAIKGAFQEMGAFSGSSLNMSGATIIVQSQDGAGNPQFEAAPGTPTSLVLSGANIVRSSPTTPLQNTDISGQNSGLDTEALRKQLQDALGDEIKNKKVQMRIGPEGLVVSLREIGFFRSGDAVLVPEAKPTITRLAKILEEKHFAIRVEGHTDNIPIHTPRFDSNWELSTARATEVVTMLVHDFGFDPHAVSVAGYAEFHPIASNDTEEGRKANRRIDLVVIGETK